MVSPQCTTFFYPIKWWKDLQYNWLKFDKQGQSACCRKGGFSFLESIIYKARALQYPTILNDLGTFLKMKLASPKSIELLIQLDDGKLYFGRMIDWKEGLHILCIKGGRTQKRRSFHFRASHTSERYLSAISLDEKLPGIEEKQTLFLSV